ncbi:MAG: DNA-deoxyinosine glycosylase [Deltaproteobacteria bacterium]|nr:DNA-deoxyinosine glycosylase [Deltaproteobacteria bacterium]
MKSLPHVCCFAPIADAYATTLILGSMPGKESLRAGQYYAHPRNAFWPILGELVGAAPALPYAERAHVLRAAGLALWDVLASCARPTSLDSDIDNGTLVANEFAAFFACHQNITRVFFNGTKADECYRRHVLPNLHAVAVRYARLPSTSPANASIPYSQKLAAWRVIVE